MIGVGIVVGFLVNRNEVCIEGKEDFRNIDSYINRMLIDKL